MNSEFLKNLLSENFLLYGTTGVAIVKHVCKVVQLI